LLHLITGSFTSKGRRFLFSTYLPRHLRFAPLNKAGIQQDVQMVLPEGSYNKWIMLLHSHPTSIYFYIFPLYFLDSSRLLLRKLPQHSSLTIHHSAQFTRCFAPSHNPRLWLSKTFKWFCRKGSCNKWIMLLHNHPTSIYFYIFPLYFLVSSRLLPRIMPLHSSLTIHHSARFTGCFASSHNTGYGYR
jgi:hypothetical protein